MIVTVDGERLDQAFAADCTLHQLVEQARAACAQRLIVAVALNGKRLSEDDLNTALSQRLPDDAQVDLDSGDAGQLIHDALCGLAVEFEQGQRRAAEIANGLVAGQAAGIRDMGELIGLWQTAQRVLIQCSGLIGNDLTQRVVEGQTFRQRFDDVARQLCEVRAALDARDLVLLADQVRYELSELCGSWHTLLRSLAEQVQPAQDGF